MEKSVFIFIILSILFSCLPCSHSPFLPLPITFTPHLFHPTSFSRSLSVFPFLVPYSLLSLSPSLTFPLFVPSLYPLHSLSLFLPSFSPSVFFSFPHPFPLSLLPSIAISDPLLSHSLSSPFPPLFPCFSPFPFLNPPLFLPFHLYPLPNLPFVSLWLTRSFTYFLFFSHPVKDSLIH